MLHSFHILPRIFFQMVKKNNNAYLTDIGKYSLYLNKSNMNYMIELQTIHKLKFSILRAFRVFEIKLSK